MACEEHGFELNSRIKSPIGYFLAELGDMDSNHDSRLQRALSYH